MGNRTSLANKISYYCIIEIYLKFLNTRSPPPAESKNVVFKLRSVNNIVIAPANTGNNIVIAPANTVNNIVIAPANTGNNNNNKKAVTHTVQTNKGKRLKLIPRQRILFIVINNTHKFTKQVLDLNQLFWIMSPIILLTYQNKISLNYWQPTIEFKF